MTPPSSRTRVLIAGAGPVGLALAIELGHRGVSCLLVERNDRVGHAARAKTTKFVMDEAVANARLLSGQLYQEGLEDAGDAGTRLRAQVGARIQAAKMREFNTLGVVLGYRYDDSPIVVGDGSEPPAHDFVNYVPSARPGSIAPHAWLHDGSSLYDHFGQGFTLLALPGADAHALESARKAANALGVPLDVIEPQVPALGELYRARYALIRPDQHVAWRGDRLPDHPEQLFARICGRAGAESPAESSASVHSRPA